MPLYDYCCPQGHYFEQMATIAARAQQPCPACGQVSGKIPSRVSLAGRADPGPSMEQMPQTWRGTYEGNPEYLGQLRRQWGPGRNSRRNIEDQINAGGYKVWPREVEDILYQHEAVREAAVVGVPDAYRGETVKAFVSLRPGKTATAEELIAFCRSQMAAYKYPRQVQFLDELPKTVSGKLLRRELRGG